MEHHHIDLASLREEYKMNELHEESVFRNPIEQFNTWFEEVLKAHVEEPNAMTLSTVNHDGIPSSRVVLLKGIEDDGFVFFTNYSSAKGSDIESNPHVALNFFWKELQRQVRVQGVAHRLSAEKSDAYFLSRPYGSQEGAWASPQSKVIGSRAELDERMEKIKSEFKSKEMCRPPFWGGFVVVPVAIEFWQGRPNRLHDRIQFRKEGNEWRIVRLAP